MIVTLHEPKDDPKWMAFLHAGHLVGLEYDLAWRGVFSDTYGHRPHYLAAYSGMSVVGVMPLFAAPVWGAGRCLVSTPFLDCGGPLADSDAAREALLGAALEMRATSSAPYLEIRSLTPDNAATSVRTDKAKVVLDLPVDEATLWQQLDAKVRNQVRKAQKAGLTVAVEDAEQVPSFHRVYARNMRDLGSPAAHPKLWTNVFRHFGDRARLILVRHRDVPIAGAIWLSCGQIAYVPWASALRSHFHLCPNNLLYWEAVRMACAAGCRQFDFGRSTVHSGPYRFKLQWGARPVQLYWHYYCRPGVRPPVAAQERRSLQLAEAAWKRFPLPIANMLGPRILGRMP